jgi:hypothetical protein
MARKIHWFAHQEGLLTRWSSLDGDCNKERFVRAMLEMSRMLSTLQDAGEAGREAKGVTERVCQ